MTNMAIISGRLSGEPSYSHSVNDEHFSKFYLSVIRESGAEDIIPIIASVSLIEQSLLVVGVFVQVAGQYRAYTDSEHHKSVFVLARCVSLIDEVLYVNDVHLEGAICQEPCYRHLSCGKEITGLCVANNQKLGKSYYLPVIVWDKFAKEVSDYEVGDVVECMGRIQSRCYPKDGHVRTVYEMSVSDICRTNDNK